MPKIQQSLANFASKYKQGPNVVQDGKAQAPLNMGEGKEDADTLFKFVAEELATLGPIDPSNNGSAKVAMNTSWVYGNMPGSTLAALPPFGCAMWKCLMMGTIRCVFFELASLGAAIGKDAMTYDALRALVLQAGPEVIEGWVSKGAMIRSHSHEPHDIVYVPVGWIVAEHTVGGTLIYGCRKSVIYDTIAAKRGFGSIIALYKASKKEVKKMEALVASLS